MSGKLRRSHSLGYKRDRCSRACFMADINKIAWNEVEITRSGPIRYVTREPTNGISIALRLQRPRRRRARQHCYFMFSMRIYARFASEFCPVILIESIFLSNKMQTDDVIKTYCELWHRRAMHRNSRG